MEDKNMNSLDKKLCTMCGTAPRTVGSRWCNYCTRTEMSDIKESFKHLTLQEVFDLLPKSERTLLRYLRRQGHYGDHKFLNDMGHPCEYRIIGPLGNELGMVKYYQGRLLSCYEKVAA